jgi:hypothetical protein
MLSPDTLRDRFSSLIAGGYTTTYAIQPTINHRTVAQHVGDMLCRAHARNRCELGLEDMQWNGSVVGRRAHYPRDGPAGILTDGGGRSDGDQFVL